MTKQRITTDEDRAAMEALRSSATATPLGTDDPLDRLASAVTHLSREGRVLRIRATRLDERVSQLDTKVTEILRILRILAAEGQPPS